MLDTSRNFYPVEDILRTIREMSANTLNLFRWHITVSRLFPLAVPSEPDLAAKGSYGLDMQYSPNDVARIVQFGLEHGVRVLPEIDLPGYYGWPTGGTLSQLLEIFVNSTLPYILPLKRTVIYWEGVLLDDNVKVSTTVLPSEHSIL